MSTRIRRARALARFSQTELARKVGVERSSVTQWESVKGTSPSVAHLASIALETRVCFEWLATGRGPARPDAGAFDEAVVLDEYAQDSLEVRLLTAVRRLRPKRKLALVEAVELLCN
jgi:transcriptional regulator with XRE-family HTH domain